MKFLNFIFLMLVSTAYAEKISLECKAFDFEIENQLNRPLQQGSVRYVGQALAGFLDSDDYSLTITTECKGKKEEAICLNLTDSHYCTKPNDVFKFRGLRDDGSIAMISDRCDGSWTKYQLIGESSDELSTKAYMEERTFFQLKNQIQSGINIERDKPVLLITAKDNITFDAKLVSFRKELWKINTFDPLRNKLKVSLESYENNLHESISLTSSCTRK